MAARSFGIRWAPGLEDENSLPRPEFLPVLGSRKVVNAQNEFNRFRLSSSVAGKARADAAMVS